MTPAEKDDFVAGVLRHLPEARAEYDAHPAEVSEHQRQIVAALWRVDTTEENAR